MALMAQQPGLDRPGGSLAAWGTLDFRGIGYARARTLRWLDRAGSLLLFLLGDHAADEVLLCKVPFSGCYLASR